MVIVREFLIMCIPNEIGFRIPSIDILLKFIVYHQYAYADRILRFWMLFHIDLNREVFLEQIAPHPEK